MRIARLDLLQYGHFDACRLAFPAAPLDLHVVFGANEAGKSTTRAAVTDLLFGFGKTTPYAFRFDNALLRVGAALDEAGATLELKRRKGNKDTLLDASDMVLPDATLAPLLHGLTREAFERGFALDHAQLRKGGRAVLEADGDVGQALVAAGSGLLGVQRLAEALREECEAIWAPSARTRRLHVSERAVSDATKRLRDAEVRPQQWVTAEQVLAGLTAQRDALMADRAVLEAEHRGVQRTRRLIDPVRRREALHADIRSIPASPFDPASEAAFAAALETIRTQHALAEQARMEADGLGAQLADHAADPVAMARAADIEALADAAAVARKAMLDLPHRRQELEALSATVGRLGADIGRPAGPLAALQAGMPSGLLLQTLDALVQSATTAAARHDKAKTDLTQAVARAADAAATLAVEPSGADAEELQHALAQAQRALPVHEGLAARRRAGAKAVAGLTAAMTRLAPWTGPPTALAAVVAPSPAETDTAATSIDRARHEAVDAGRAQDDAADAIARVTLAKAQVATTQGAIPLADLLSARRSRDTLMAAVRAHLRGENRLEDPASTAAALEAGIATADSWADRRFTAAEASAHLVALDHELERHTLDRTQAVARRDRAVAALTAAEAAWAACLDAAGLPPIPPARAHQWRTDQAAALAAAEAADQAEAALAGDLATIEAAADALRALLGRTDALLPALLTITEAERTRRVHNDARRIQLATEVLTARRANETARADVETTAGEITRSEAEWLDAVAGTALAGTTVLDGGLRLVAIRETRGKLDQALALERRIAEIVADLARFDASAQALALACGMAPPASGGEAGQDRARALSARLATARQTAQSRLTLEQRRAALEDRHRTAQGTITAARAVLAPLVAHAGTEDLVPLGNALDQVALRRRNEAGIRDADHAIQLAGGLDLGTALADLAAADPDVLAQRDGYLTDEIAALHARAMALGQQIGHAESALAALDRGAEAAGAAAELEQARAQAAADAEDYLLRRTQAVLLSWAIERFRDRHQNPMLTRAETLFRTLTLGRYAALQLALDGDAPRLLAIRDGRTVGVSAMSEGTADQLFLALRLAAVEQSVAAGMVVPFVADDLFVNFDDDRAEAGFRVLGELARQTQVLFFTHHDHLRAIADRALHPDIVSSCALGDA